MRFSGSGPPIWRFSNGLRMIEHAFGGDWTEDKLMRLAKYLAAYRNIFTINPKARHFATWYVDAFAGTGSRSASENAAAQGLLDEVYEDAESRRYRDGSAKIALGLTSPFDRYLFIEKSKSRIAELGGLIQRDFPSLATRCELKQADANTVLCAWCKERDWAKERAVVFLDPYGMQVEWSTIQALGATKAVDLWYLFPLGVARMLTRDGKIEDSWRKRLTILFGTAEWEERFYRMEAKKDLFGEWEQLQRDATVESIQGYINERLATCFTAVADSLVLRNSKTSPLFALCFAAANERGAPTALKIAKSILKD
jgi:three-Cys-motif partner protein